MASEQIRALISELPYAMQFNVEGYVDAVDAVAEEIARDAGVRLTSDLRNQFLLIVAVRKIWTAVNGQYWIIQRSSNLAQERGLDGFQIGRETVEAGSETNTRARQLRDALERELRRLEIEEPVFATTLAEVLQMLDMERQ
jgi:hypothetical protein